VEAVGSLVKLTPEENWYDMAEAIAQEIARGAEFASAATE